MQAQGVGSWIWDLRPWLGQPEQLITRARQHGVGSLLLQLPIEGGEIADLAKVQRLIDVLAAAGIVVRAVEGDPEMASAEGRANALERARIIRRFRQAGAGLHSVQYDIEPYLMAGHKHDPAAAWREWTKTIGQLAACLGAKVSVAVPFRMLDDLFGEGALLKAAGSISDIVVMAYRTDMDQVE
ncbi:hypothetical protein EET67_21285 [Pseudaminobacter arsenicus]|uniref:Sugar phosphate isomerase/epimerase n=1 Tax=Borborobacter arsenicus TaxID=1851146 RepID=A0A432V149_9HYPH|nr:hypothetical protein [Pseudaminobacter arsenicus]RUM95825.1 hypothetical protein EET67_21285 [Pseudaminobacter arsenicus]